MAFRLIRDGLVPLLQGAKISSIDFSDIDISNGAAHVITSTGLGITSNRELPVATEATATWTEAEGITHIICEVAGAAVGDECLVVFDAPDPSTQTAWLANAGSASAPTPRETWIVGQQYERFFPSSTPLRQIGAVANGVGATKLIITAGK